MLLVYGSDLVFCVDSVMVMIVVVFGGILSYHIELSFKRQFKVTVASFVLPGTLKVHC